MSLIVTRPDMPQSFAAISIAACTGFPSFTSAASRSAKALVLEGCISGRMRLACVVHGHQPEGVRSVARPIVVRPKANASRVVSFLVIPAQRIAPRLGLAGVEPDRWEQPADGLNTGHRCACAHVRDHTHVKPSSP